MAEVRGLAELLETIDRLPAKIENRVLAHALRKGALVLVRKIRANIGGLELSESGKNTLRKAIYIRRMRGRRVGFRVLIKKPKSTDNIKADAFFWRWVEKGTAPRARKRGLVFGRKVDSFKRPAATGKMKAQAFVGPALEAAKAEVEQVIAQAAREKFASELTNP